MDIKRQKWSIVGAVFFLVLIGYYFSQFKSQASDLDQPVDKVASSMVLTPSQFGVGVAVVGSVAACVAFFVGRRFGMKSVKFSTDKSRKIKQPQRKAKQGSFPENILERLGKSGEFKLKASTSFKKPQDLADPNLPNAVVLRSKDVTGKHHSGNHVKGKETFYQTDSHDLYISRCYPPTSPKGVTPAPKPSDFFGPSTHFETIQRPLYETYFRDIRWGSDTGYGRWSSPRYVTKSEDNVNKFAQKMVDVAKGYRKNPIK